jgi:gluconokinase
MGVSGSGKTTIADRLAARLDWRFEDGDGFHPPGNVAKMSAGQPLTDDDRRPWLQAIADEIDRVSREGEPLVVACSALKRAYRDILSHGRTDVRFVFLNGSYELIASRLAARKGHFMPPGPAREPVQDTGTARYVRTSRRRVDRRAGRDDRRRHHPPTETGCLMTRIALVVSGMSTARC